MMRYCFLFLFLVFSVGCGGAPTAETTGRIDFTLERTIGRGEVLAYPRHVATLEDGTVLVGDGVTVHRFSPDGAHLGQFGSLGSGPGEFESLATMVVNMDDEILIWDSRSRRLSFWSGAGEFLRSQPFDQGSTVISILPKDTGYTLAYVVPTDSGEIPYWLHDFGLDLREPIRHYMAYELSALSDLDSPVAMTTPGYLARVENGFVWAPHLYDGNVIHIGADGKETVVPGMPVSGTLVEVVGTREDGNFSLFRGGDQGGTHLRFRYFGTGLFSMPDGGLLNFVEVDSYPNSPDRRTEVRRFDEDLDISATRSLTRADSLGTPLHMDSSGRLYTVRTVPEPHIAVWRVTIAE